MTEESRCTTSSFATVHAVPRQSLGRVLLASLFILVLAQLLTGALSLSALNRLAANNTADRVELATRQGAANIQNGLNLGKPLAQYFGLERVLEGLAQQLPGLQGAGVVLPDGQVLASVGKAPQALEVLLALNGQPQVADRQIVLASADAARQFSRDQVRLAIALAEPGKHALGALVVDIKNTDAGRRGMLTANAAVLAVTTLAAALVLVVVLRFLLSPSLVARRPVVLKAVPLAVLLLAQSVYASYTINTFRTVWLDVTHANARWVVQGVQHDFERVLAYGIAPDRFVGAESYFARVVDAFPVIRELSLYDADRQPLVRADANGALEVNPSTPLAAHDIRPQPSLNLTGPLSIVMPLYAHGSDPMAWLHARLDPAQLRSGVWARVLDAGTVAVIALVAALELLLLLELVLGGHLFAASRGAGRTRRSARPHEPESTVPLSANMHRGALDHRVALLARPLMFGFLFAWAMPLGFLPVYARSLVPADTATEQLQLLMALPIAAEMGWGLLMALLAGRLIDRRGWQTPVFAGLLLSGGGSLACAGVTSIGGLVLARSLVGLGYGLTWMGLQGFVVLYSPASSRGRNMASVIAGLFAGHMSGAAVGAMVMEQLGATAVFYAGALLFALPLAGAVFVAALLTRSAVGLRADQSTRSVPGPIPAPRASSSSPSARQLGTMTTPVTSDSSASTTAAIGASRGRIRQLLFSRDFGLLLLASIVPFSVAQVGLLSFALPLYLEADGYPASSVGRVLMLYGLCVIYLGPLMGRLADRSADKKGWIVAAGLTGSAGLLSFALFDGVAAAVIAVLCLALAGCLAGGAQSAYMLALKNVERYGAVGATSVMRGADKVGQMLGPLVVAALFAVTSMRQGLAVTGALYLLASLVFMLWAPGSRGRQGSSAVPGE